MKRHGNVMLVVAGACMEMCWLYGWATFCFSAIFGRPFPLLEAAMAFVLGAWITRLATGRGWRIAAIFGLEAVGFACALSVSIHGTHFSGYPLFGMVWPGILANGAHSPFEWLGLILTVLWTFLFWVGGATLSRRQVTYYAFCSRFDIGLGAFFCLFLIRLAVLVKGGTRIDDPLPQLLILPFFFFSLFAVGMARVRGDGFKSFLPGYRATGVVLGFASSALLLIAGLTVLFVSGLSTAARATQGAIKTAFSSSFPIIERVLRIIFSRADSMRAEPAISRKTGAFDAYTWAKDSWWIQFLDRTLGIGLWGLFVALSVAVVGLGVFFLVRWFFSRTALDRGTAGEGGGLFAWLRRVREFVTRLMNVLRRLARRQRRATEVYGALLRWGGRSGLSPAASETPLEFGTRLHRYFPQLTPEINLIVHAYNGEVYGERGLTDERLERVRLAWRAVRSPSYWLLRLKVRFVGREERLTGR